jgi:hypothetical protein
MGFSIGQFGPDAWTDRSSRAYRIHMPHDTQIAAACEDVGCDSWRFGWETVADESDPAQAQVAMVIRSGQSGRTFREMSDVRDGRRVAVFRFDARQRCFAEHRTRPGVLRVYSGGRPAREHVSLSDLAEDYTEHMGGIADQQERG